MKCTGYFMRLHNPRHPPKQPKSKNRAAVGKRKLFCFASQWPGILLISESPVEVYNEFPDVVLLSRCVRYSFVLNRDI